MKFFLTVLNGKWHSGSTLHEYVIPGNLWLPEGAWVELPVGLDADNSVNGYVQRTYFDLRTAEVGVELKPFRLDPPPNQGAGSHESIWRTEQDGDLRAKLAAGGWRKL